jgi:hypothetical protein
LHIIVCNPPTGAQTSVFSRPVIIPHNIHGNRTDRGRRRRRLQNKTKKMKRKLCKSAHGDTQHLMMSTVNCMRCRNNSKCDFPLGNNRQKSKQQLITIPHWTGANKNHQIFSAHMIYLLFIDFPPCCFK